MLRDAIESEHSGPGQRGGMGRVALDLNPSHTVNGQYPRQAKVGMDGTLEKLG